MKKVRNGMMGGWKEPGTLTKRLARQGGFEGAGGVGQGATEGAGKDGGGAWREERWIGLRLRLNQ